MLLGRDHWARVAASARGDNGARAYLAGRPDEVVEVDCTGTGVPTDVDLPTDLVSLGPERRR